jgi:hypothetical protein
VLIYRLKSLSFVTFTRRKLEIYGKRHESYNLKDVIVSYTNTMSDNGGKNNKLLDPNIAMEFFSQVSEFVS